jgi:hypothetical protein
MDSLNSREQEAVRRLIHVCCPELNLKDDMPRLPYRENRVELDNVIHCGQRKLLLNEVRLLTENQNVRTWVYAGSAPGIHMRVLSKCFPNVSFILYDPRKFKIKDTDKIEIHNTLFTNEEAEKYEGCGLISDIRTGETKEEIARTTLLLDMSLQKSWGKIMEPPVSMYKFRLPWYNGMTEYFDGEVWIQPFVGLHSTETRLVVKDINSSKLYDNTTYEQQLYYHNVIRPFQIFNHGIQAPEDLGLDRCYDCASEVLIWKRYIKNYKNEEPTNDEVVKLISLTSKLLGKSNVLTKDQHGHL